MHLIRLRIRLLACFFKRKFLAFSVLEFLVRHVLFLKDGVQCGSLRWGDVHHCFADGIRSARKSSSC